MRESAFGEEVDGAVRFSDCHGHLISDDVEIHHGQDLVHLFLIQLYQCDAVFYMCARGT